MTAQRELEGVLQEAVELKVDVSIPDDTKKALEEAEEMRVRWEGECKAKEEYAACLDGGEGINNEATRLFDNDASPTCKAEEEVREPTPMVKLMAKPAPVKWLEFHTMRAMPASSPSAHRSVRSMEVMIPVQCKVSRLTADWAILTKCTALSGGRARQGE